MLGTTPHGCNPSTRSPRMNSPVMIGGGTTVSPTRTGIQEIVSPKGSTGSVEVKNTQIFNISINVNWTNKGESTLILSKVIRQELSHNSSSDIYSRCRDNFMSDSVGTKIPDFMNLGLPAVNALDEPCYQSQKSDG